MNRSEEARSALLECGAETLLREVRDGAGLDTLQDAAAAGLRDLGIDDYHVRKAQGVAC